MDQLTMWIINFVVGVWMSVDVGLKAADSEWDWAAAFFILGVLNFVCAAMNYKESHRVR